MPYGIIRFHHGTLVVEAVIPLVLRTRGITMLLPPVIDRNWNLNRDRDWRKLPGQGFYRDRDSNRDRDFYRDRDSGWPL